MVERYKYCENNIQFRIKSSKLIADYKEMQEFNLKEMVYGNYPFPEGTREIFLLKLDIWFRFTIQLEEELIKLGHNNISEVDLELIHNIAKTAESKYTSIMEDDAHGNHFNSEIYEIWKETHKSLFEYLIKEVDSTIGLTPVESFEYIIVKLIEVLQTTLYELFETINLDRIFKGVEFETYCSNGFERGKIYLCYSEMCYLFRNRVGKNLLIERLSVYLRHFDIKEVALRDYSRSGIPIECIQDTIQQLNFLGIDLDVVSTLGKPSA